MIPFRRDKLIHNNVEYRPASFQRFAESHYGILLDAGDGSGSEKSYEAADGAEGIFASFVFLSFNAAWSLTAAITTAFIYTLLSYREFFDAGIITEHAFLALLYITACGINLIDIVSSLLHYFSKEMRDTGVHARKNHALIGIDTLSIAATVVDGVMSVALPGSGAWTKCALLVATLRVYRFAQYFCTVTWSPLRQGLAHVLTKYMLLTFVLNHTAACFWRLSACFNCNDGMDHWNSNIGDASTHPSWLYIVCMFNALDSTTRMGLVGGSARNGGEFLLTMVLMFYSMLINTGVFLGAFTEVQVESNKRGALYKTMLRQIKEELEDELISAELRQRVTTWYVNCWLKEHAVIRCPLIRRLPPGFRRNIEYDKYFNALNRSHHLRHLHDEVKIVLARSMYTTYHTEGDVILQQGRAHRGLIYVAKGVVQLVSPDDIESPIIMFEYGTSIGSTSMLYAFPAAAHLMATTYCQIYNLRGVDFWRALARCYKLKPAPPIFEANSFIMNNARQKQQRKLLQRRQERADKTLKLVKDILKTHGRRARCEITDRLSENNLLGVYQISKGAGVVAHMDTTFLSRSFPWILYERTHFGLAWEYIVFTIAALVIVAYPYFLFHLPTPPPVYYQFLRPLAYTVFAVDVIIQLCTSAVDEYQQVISTFSEIMIYRFGKPMFLIDVLSVTPFELIGMMTGAELAEHVAYLECNHMLKVFRAFSRLVDITNSLHVQRKAIRIVFYIICLLYFGYLQGIVFYKTVCPKRPCDSETWISIHLDYVSQFRPGLRDSVSYVLLVAMYDGVMFLTGTAGVLTSHSIREQAVLACFCLSYLYLFTYLLADYSATLTLDGYLQNQFRTEVSNLTKFMRVANIDRNTIFRMNIYMETIYKLSNGRVMPTVFEAAPANLRAKMSEEKILPHLFKLPLFRQLSKNARQNLIGRLKYDIYPPNEYVAHAGDQSYNMYIIQKGYCEIQQLGEHLIKSIGPGDSAGFFEMILRLPLLHNIRTVTNMKLCYFNVNDFCEALHMDEPLEPLVRRVIDATRSTTIVERIFYIGKKESYVPASIANAESALIRFKAGKMDAKTLDLHQGWEGLSMLGLFMQKTTIRPDSTFIYIYVMFHALVALMSATLYPALFILECIMPWYAVLLLSLPWDLLCLIDVYLRLHVCYYNANGLLVSHPRHTATHYLGHSFAVDFSTALPLKLILDRVMSKRAAACVLFIKVVRAYRIPNGFAYFRRDVLKPPPAYLLILHYLTLSLVFWNATTLGLVLTSVEFGTAPNGDATIRPVNGSWFYTKANSEITFDGRDVAPLKLYVLALYSITSFSLQINLADVIMIRRIELLYIILTIISGYVWFTYILVIIANTKTVYNDNLTKYQNNLRDLCLFMNAQSIPKRVKRRSVRHFNYTYERNQGYRDQGIFDELHLTLKRDCKWELYCETLLRLPTFTGMATAFYQNLCAESHMCYYLADSDILCVNDVVNWVYIVAHGGVEVIGASGHRIAELSQGSMFGNLDNVEYSRCMLRYRTVTAADVLCLETSGLYRVLEEYPEAQHLLKMDLYNNNFCYVQSQGEPPAVRVHAAIISKWKRFLMSTWIRFIIMTLSYLSYQLALYHVAFQTHSAALYIVSYLLDALHVLKIYILFQVPYSSKHGELITTRSLLKKRALKRPTFYIDLLAVIPLEIFALACPQTALSTHTFISIFRLNRLLRFLNISLYISVTHDRLHVNAIVIKVVSLLIYSTTYLHTLACIWYLVACPNRACVADSWMYDGGTNRSNCPAAYLCALYYVASLMSAAGFSTFIPRRIVEIHLTIVTIVLSKFVTTMLVANMAALVRHFGFRLQRFTERVNVMRTFFKNSSVSPHLQHNVLGYIERLWMCSYGKQMPNLLHTGPAALVEEIKIFAFGAHIFANPVFRDCHNDFLRLLATHAKLVRHFMGDVICAQGEINDTMYFIHWGQVEVVCIAGRLEVQVDLLTQLDCFGMIQGLFPDTPHSHTYKAAGSAEIVTLHLADWMQILAFYPAARFHIYRTIRDYRALYAYIRRPT